MPFRGAIYPNKIFGRIAIPRKIIIVSDVVVLMVFIYFIFMFFSNKNNFRINPLLWEIIMIPLSIFFSIFCHEINHAIIASCVGGVVAEIGVHCKPISYKTIVFFPQNNDVDMCLFFSAGIVANMILAIIGIFLYYQTHMVLFFFLIISNLVLILFNSIPFSKKNDGYRIMSTIIRHRI